MPRQNQYSGSFVREVTGVVPVNKGGTGADNPVDAVDNLNGLHRATIDQANGLATLGQGKLLLPEYFSKFKAYIGPRIKGPTVIQRNCCTQYLITNPSSDTEINITFYDQTGDEIPKESMYYHIDAPYFRFNVVDDFITEVKIALNYYNGRDNAGNMVSEVLEYVVPVEDPYIAKPVIKTPTGTVFNTRPVIEVTAPEFIGDAIVLDTSDRYTGAYKGTYFYEESPNNGARSPFSYYSGEAEISPNWPVSCVVIGGKLTHPDNIAYAEIDGVRYPLSTTEGFYRVKYRDSMKVKIVTSGSQNIAVGFLKPTQGHLTDDPNSCFVRANIEVARIGTEDWERATNDVYSKVTNSLQFPLNLLTAEHSGQLKVRVRYEYIVLPYQEVATLVSEYSDPINIDYVFLGIDRYTATFLPPHLQSSKFFGSEIAVLDKGNQSELFITGQKTDQGRLVYQHRAELINAPYQLKCDYLTSITAPNDATRAQMLKFGEKLAVTEDGNLLFISAPDAVYSDVTGTTGVVYVYRRSGQRWVLLERLFDPDRLAKGFGTHLLVIGDQLIVGNEADAQQKPTLYIYDIGWHDDVASVSFGRSYIDQRPQLSVLWYDIVAPKNYDKIEQTIPVCFFYVEGGSGGYTYKKALYLYTPTNGSFSEVSVTDLAAASALNDPVYRAEEHAMTLKEYDEATRTYSGQIYSLTDNGSNIVEYTWMHSFDSGLLTDEPSSGMFGGSNYVNGTGFKGLNTLWNGNAIVFGNPLADIETIGGPTMVDAGSIYITTFRPYSLMN